MSAGFARILRRLHTLAEAGELHGLPSATVRSWTAQAMQGRATPD